MMAAIKLLLTSRKGVLAGFVILVSTVYAIGVVVAAFKGLMGWDAALMRLLGPLVTQTLAALSVVWGVSTEDAAAKGNVTLFPRGDAPSKDGGA